MLQTSEQRQRNGCRFYECGIEILPQMQGPSATRLRLDNPQESHATGLRRTESTSCPASACPSLPHLNRKVQIGRAPIVSAAEPRAYPKHPSCSTPLEMQWFSIARESRPIAWRAPPPTPDWSAHKKYGLPPSNPGQQLHLESYASTDTPRHAPTRPLLDSVHPGGELELEAISHH